MGINVVEEFLTLVKIDSPSKKEGDLSKYLKSRLKELGADVIEDGSARLTGSDTGNIIGIYPGDKDKPVILLAAHMDTIVSTKGMIPQIKDGVIYSDGQTILGADDKAGIAIILALLSRLQAEDTNQECTGHGTIEILFSVQEEIGLIGAKNLDYPLRSTYGYVLDADGPVGSLIHASPSHMTLDLVVEGKAAHAGVAPEAGVNAIVVASKAIASIHSGRLDQETTSNFGIISGGKGRNIVADRVEIKAEVRSRDMKKLEKETEGILRKFEETAKMNNAKFSYEKNLAYEAFTLDAKHPAVANAIKAAGSLEIEVKLKATGGGMDANILNTRGISCAAIGLGNGNPHTNQEYINIEEMEKAVAYLLEILKTCV